MLVRDASIIFLDQTITLYTNISHNFFLISLALQQQLLRVVHSGLKYKKVQFREAILFAS